MFFRSLTFKIISILLAINLAVGLYCHISNCISANYCGTIQRFDALTRIVRLIRNEHVDSHKIQATELVDAALDAASSTQDPFTEFLPPEDLQALDECTSGQFGGCGVAVALKDGKLAVIRVFPNSPAEKAGIIADDIIDAVDGNKLPENDESLGGNLLRGAPGTTIKITLLRPGEEAPIIVSVKREIITVDSVDRVHIIEGTSIGYVAITEFQERTGDDFSQEVQSLIKEHKISGLIMDLRGNPGGLLSSAIDICSQFIQEGELVVTTECNTPKRNVSYYAITNHPAIPESIKLVILIDENSASAAEITASCLRDCNRATLVGMTSFGKGSVQNVIDLPGNRGLKITIAKYYTKSHREIHEIGITPDIEIPVDKKLINELSICRDTAELDKRDPQLQAALKFLEEETNKS